MLAYIKSSGDQHATRTFHCAHCGVFITKSDELVAINSSTEHIFVNPAGIRCHFLTFSHCENVLADRELYLEHSWFQGYGWRFLVCGNCYLHLGWKYDSVDEAVNPDEFFGVLVKSIRMTEQTE